MKQLLLKNGEFTTVDDYGFELLQKFKWNKNSRGYVVTYVWDSNTQKSKVIRLHRFLMNPPEDLLVDHIDGNPLNNLRANLRVCTSSQNQMNRNREKTNSSGFKGVSWYNPSKKWHVVIGINGKNKHIGYFNNRIHAARAYDEHAKKLHGQFAKLNFNYE